MEGEAHWPSTCGWARGALDTQVWLLALEKSYGLLSPQYTYTRPLYTCPGYTCRELCWVQDAEEGPSGAGEAVGWELGDLSPLRGAGGGVLSFFFIARERVGPHGQRGFSGLMRWGCSRWKGVLPAPASSLCPLSLLP